MKTFRRPAIYFFTGLLAGILIVGGLAFRKSDSATADNATTQQDVRLKYKWYAPELPNSISFAGEPAPLDKWEVRERLDREMDINYYLHGSLMYILKLTTRYFPVIEDRLKANGIPDDFKYVCVAESSLQQASVSNTGAASYWQFMKDTGPHYGLEINDEVDERYNIKKATDAACKYFKEAHDKFGNWTAAAASYNCGQGGYSSQMQFQGTANFYDMGFPEETARYIFRILALKYLITNAKLYGYIVEATDEYKPIKTKTVTVDTSVSNLADFAKANGSNYKMLKLLNPWLRAHSLKVKAGKSYAVEFPVE
jgi:membrane-bound lytic murein transglycosylase D